MDLKKQHNRRQRNTYVYLEYSDEPLETANSLEPEPPLIRQHSEHVRKQTEFYGHCSMIIMHLLQLAQFVHCEDLSTVV